MEIIKTNLKFGTLTKRSSTARIILHHAAGNGSVEDIHRIHKNNGWSGIGYHFYVRKNGEIYAGRPDDMIGAHAAGSNYNSIGVCFEGNFETEQMSDAQKQSGKELVAYLKDKYKISVVQRHRDVNATACPGKNFPFSEIAGSTDYTSATETIEQTTQAKSYASEIVLNGQKYANKFIDDNISEDGIRGTQTATAGRKVLQHAMNLDYKANLKEDGIIGTLSQKTLKPHYVKYGETQYMVTALEILLMLKGYNPKGVECPGEFGSGLKAATMQYQKDHGLTIDGIAGYYTFMSLVA